ncbi:hypothetical protein C2G38_2127344 [Gigaspora rosea]|uniref:Uncharacterized protein n=1 Tax=Gigaspora rosea TaxID=44941 RepID=A0A397TXN7_9GLOM|nr:hypothetical protein C2G38_2127344 [Gigaspora rosea]
MKKMIYCYIYLYKFIFKFILTFKNFEFVTQFRKFFLLCCPTSNTLILRFKVALQITIFSLCLNF